MATKGTGKDDFIAESLARQVDDHTKDMGLITKRLDELEARFGTNEKIANTLCEVEENAVKMGNCIEKSISKILINSDPVNNQIKKIIAESDRSYIAQQLRQYRVWIYGALLFIAAQGSIELIKFFIHHELDASQNATTRSN